MRWTADLHYVNITAQEKQTGPAEESQTGRLGVLSEQQRQTQAQQGTSAITPASKR